MTEPSSDIPKRGSYKASEVCEIAHIQPYVLRSWEQEFPRLGVVRAGQRVYRHADLEQVLKIRHLVFDEGLTLGGARRRLEEEGQPQPELPLEETVTPELKERIGRVRHGLRELMTLLGGTKEEGPAVPGSGAPGVGGEKPQESTEANARAVPGDGATSGPSSPVSSRKHAKVPAKPRGKGPARPRAHAARKTTGAARRTRRA